MTGSDRDRRGLWWLPLSLLVIVLDLWTKAIALDHLSYADPVPVLPFLNWTLVYNYGGAFSFLSDHGGWQRWFFLIVASAVTLALLVWLARSRARAWLPCLPLSLLIGGAIGNLVDRARLGYVVDFIDVYYRSWHWPAFNIADAAISVGIVLLIGHEVFGGHGARGTGHGSSGRA